MVNCVHVMCFAKEILDILDFSHIYRETRERMYCAHAVAGHASIVKLTKSSKHGIPVRFSIWN